jgi:hypothetical protein
VRTTFFLLCAFAATFAWASYHEQYYRNLGEFAFLSQIEDDGGSGVGLSLQEQKKILDDTVARETAGWKAHTQRFLRGRHEYMKTANVAILPFREKNPNRLCVYLTLDAGELCYSTRTPIARSGLFALRFAVTWRKVRDGGAAGLERPERWSETFMLRWRAGEWDRALDEALATHASFTAKGEGDMAASALTLQLRLILTTIPDARVVGMAEKVQTALTALPPKGLDGILAEVKLMRSEMQAGGLR